jgi:dihydrodipicolinate synthase/N-acetylneuraminate lyase
VGNLIPDVCQQLCVAAQNGKWHDAEMFYARMNSVAAVYQKGRTLNESLAALKAAVHCRGLCAPVVLPPLQSLAEIEVEKIRGVMGQLQLLNAML